MTVDAEHTPQRHATRAPVDLPVRLQFDDSVDTVEGRCTDISIGGMFLNLGTSRPPGTLVRFELELDDEDGTAIRGLGEVVWMRARAGGPGRDAGMGLKFRFLEQSDRQQIFKLVSEHIKERLAHRHGSYEGSGFSAESPARPAPPAAVVEPRREPVSAASVEDVAPRAPAPSVPAPSAPASPTGSPPSVPPPIARSTAPPVDAPPSPSRPGQQRLDFDASASTPAAPPSGPVLDEMADDFDLPLADPVTAPEPSRPPYEPPPVVEPAVMAEESGGLSWDEADETYSDYLGDDHFEHRPAPRQGPPLLPILALGLAAIIVLVYFFGGRFFDSESAETVPEPTRVGATEAPAEAPPTGAASPRQTEPPPSRQAEPSPPAQQPSAQTPAQQTAPPPPKPRAAPPARQPAPPPPRVTSPPPSRPASSRTFRRITDLQWRPAGNGIAVVITTDGPVSQDRFDSFRLENPAREVVRIFGLEARWPQPEVDVGRGGVARLRTGWHKGRRRGNELHLVFDLADARSRLTSLRFEGRQIIVEVAP